MKKIFALLISVCLFVIPVTAFAEEADYSYLEDMSVKELKALRDAINEILGDEDSFENSEPSEWEYLDAESEPYLSAIMLANLCKSGLTSPKSFELKKVRWYTGRKNKTYYYLEYSGMNKLGGVASTDVVFGIQDGNIIGYYLEYDDNRDIDSEVYYNFIQDRIEGIEDLNCKFIESKME